MVLVESSTPAFLRHAVLAYRWPKNSRTIPSLQEYCSPDPVSRTLTVACEHRGSPCSSFRFSAARKAGLLVVTALPPHLADVAAFSLATRLRAGNVTGLQWPQVDLVRRLAWVHADQAKARKAIPVPLNAEAVLLMRKWLGKHPTHVFSYRGRPITQVSSKAWYGALRKAGIEDFCWHDLRHTWASWHVQNGTPLYALQEMGGWSSVEIVRRYAHLAAHHLAPFADRLCALRVVESGIHGTTTTQSAK
jgi:integrase